jgi:hypothetical protein
MLYNNWGFWDFGLCSSSGTLKDTREHDVSELDLFLSPDDGVGDTYSVGSIPVIEIVFLTGPTE